MKGKCCDGGWVKQEGLRMACPNNCKKADKPEAKTTMLVDIVNPADKSIQTHCVKNFDLGMKRDNETLDFTLHTKQLKGLTLGMRCHVAVMATKDPTPVMAGGSVSLGFFRQRWTFKDCKLIKTNPLVFRGWSRLYDNDILLEMWDYDT